MDEEFLIDFLHDGAVEVSDGTVRQPTQQFIESIMPEKLRDSLSAELHSALRQIATTNHLGSHFSESSSFIDSVSEMIKTITDEEVQIVLPIHP